MKLQTTQDRYKGTNNELNVYKDLSRVSAYSYSWWKYITTDAVGNIIFNNYSYSHSTYSHQMDAMSILRSLGIPVALTLNHTSESLHSLPDAINSEMGELNAKANEELRKITTKGTHRAKNLKRVDYIDAIVDRILELKHFRDHFLNKKKVKLPTKGQVTIKNEDGKVDTHLTTIVNSRSSRYTVVSYKSLKPSIAEFKKWGISFAKADLFIYPHVRDVSNMLSQLDSREKRVRTKVRKLAEYKNTLALEKLHTYLVQRIERLSRDPVDKNEVIYTVNPRLEGIKDLNPIVNRYQLRSEGRRQSHCIGSSSHYHDSIMRSRNQAFNFKGYTFYTDYDLKIISAYGNSNREVPSKIISEFKKLTAKKRKIDHED